MHLQEKKENTLVPALSSNGESPSCPMSLESALQIICDACFTVFLVPTLTCHNGSIPFTARYKCDRNWITVKLECFLTNGPIAI